MLERYNAIAAYLSEQTGLIYTVEQVRHYANRKRRPLPVRAIGRRIFAMEDEIDSWIRVETRQSQRS